MDYRSALDLLGLDASEEITRDRLRRTYLRRLRDYPPERDPEGFRRLREAFEYIEPTVSDVELPAQIRRLSSAFELRLAIPTAAAPITPTIAAPITPTTAAPTAPSEPVLPTTGTPFTAAASEPLAPLTADAPVAPGAPATSEAPGAPRMLPRRPDEIATTASEDPADTDAPRADPDVPPEDPTLDALVGELLAMLERGSVDPAIELAARWRERSIDDHRTTGTATARRWALTRDLLGVAVVLPSSLLCTLAHAIAANDFATARAALERYGMRNPGKARDLDRHLFKRAKTIYALVGGMLSRAAWAGPQTDRRAEPPAVRGNKLPWTFVFVAIVMSARLAATCDTSPSTPRPHDIQLSPGTIERLRAQAPPLMQLAQRVEHDPHASSEQVAAAVAIALAARTSDCRALEAAVARLWGAPGSELGHAGRINVLLLQISRGVAAQCGDGARP